MNPNLAKRHPDYDAINRLMKAREDLFTAGFRPRLATPMLLAILGKLKDRELNGVLSKAGYRSAEIDERRGICGRSGRRAEGVGRQEIECADRCVQIFGEVAAGSDGVFAGGVENSAALSKIKAYLNKWRPVRIGLPTVANELAALGMERGPKFDSIVEQVFRDSIDGAREDAGRAREDFAETFGDQRSAEEEGNAEEGRKGARRRKRQRRSRSANAAKAGAAAKAHGKIAAAAKHPPAKACAHGKSAAERRAAEVDQRRYASLGGLSHVAAVAPYKSVRSCNSVMRRNFRGGCGKVGESSESGSQNFLREN